ncbi:hypothetical protein H4R34_000071 [Dimargaris verticillata]|uniref:P-loop containing nucleoside triphosphate hydrolase protein n=1 Tax=Dimargaris verticillata TaxID=2761393 RepID=A0A9W8BE74_9FUNG|nr:hypothetical protein H4R34_000071 [Dimargaris verticillata]
MAHDEDTVTPPTPKLPYTTPEWSEPPPLSAHFTFEVVKQGVALAELELCRDEPFIVIGRLPHCDLALEHGSLSRYHAVLQFRGERCPSLYDLGSTHGTFVNKQQLPPREYRRLYPGDQLTFGQSTRTFIFQAAVEALENLVPPPLVALHSPSTLPSSATAKRKTDLLAPAPLHSTNHTPPLSEPFYAKDPKKSLRELLESYGHDLTFRTEDPDQPGQGSYKAHVELPAEVFDTFALEIPAGVSARKRDAQTQAALLACQELNQLGLLASPSIKPLYPTHHAKRLRPGTNSEDEDSDGAVDSFFDRTMRAAHKKSKNHPDAVDKAPVVESFETLSVKHANLEYKLTQLRGQLRELEALALAVENTAVGPEAEVDALDQFMDQVNSDVQSQDRQKLVDEINRIEQEFTRIAQLREIAKPYDWKPDQTSPPSLSITQNVAKPISPTKLTPTSTASATSEQHLAHSQRPDNPPSIRPTRRPAEYGTLPSATDSDQYAEPSEEDTVTWVPPTNQTALVVPGVPALRMLRSTRAVHTGAHRWITSKQAPQPVGSNFKPQRQSRPDAERTYTFKSLLISPRLVQILNEQFGIQELTAMQGRLLHNLLHTQQDVMLRAHTGTGKSFTFVIYLTELFLRNQFMEGLLSRKRSYQIHGTSDCATPADQVTQNALANALDIVAATRVKTKRPKARSVPTTNPLLDTPTCPTIVMLVPTSDLALQVERWVEQLLTAYQTNVLSQLTDREELGLAPGEPLFSNDRIVQAHTREQVTLDAQTKRLGKGCPWLVVATPKRLLELVHNRSVQIDQVTTVIMDEADYLVRLPKRFAPEKKVIKRRENPKPAEVLVDQMFGHKATAVTPASNTKPFRTQTFKPRLLLNSATINRPLRYFLVKTKGWTDAQALYLDANATIDQPIPQTIIHHGLVIENGAIRNVRPKSEDPTTSDDLEIPDAGPAGGSRRWPASTLTSRANRTKVLGATLTDELLEVVGQICRHEPYQNILVFIHSEFSVGDFCHRLLERQGLVSHPFSAREVSHLPTAAPAIYVLKESMARGLDIPQVSHVIILGLTADITSYLHMAGRTGRMGQTGKVFTVFVQQGRLEARARTMYKLLNVTATPYELVE